MWNFLPWWLLRKAMDTGSSLLDGLVSYWPLDEISGVRYDAVGSNDLTDNNTVGAVLRGPEGTVASFVGANSEELTYNGAIPPTPSAFTVNIWFKLNPAVADGWQSILIHGNYLGLKGYAVGGRIAYAELTAYDGASYYSYGTGWAPLGVSDGSGWMMLSGVWNGTTAQFYINGETQPGWGGAGGLPNWVPYGGRVMTVGSSLGVQFITGQAARHGLWGAALTQEDLRALFAEGEGLGYTDLSAGQKSALIAWHELDEVSGVRYDSHGSNDLTDNNTVGSVNSGPKGVVASMAEANTESLSNDDVSLDSVISYSMWFKRTEAANFGNYDGFITRGGTTRGLEIFGENGGSHFYWSVHLDNGTEINTTYTVPVNDTNWHLVSVWVDMVAQRAYFKMDGHAVESSAATVTSALEATPGAFTIGNWTYGGLDAHVGPVGAWTTAIGESVHDSLFNGGVGKRYADLTDGEKVGLVSFWNLDEQSGVRYDSHGSNHLTDNNTVGSVINAGAAMDGAAASFVAANSEYLSKTSMAELGTVWTFSGWFKTTDGVNDAIFSLMDGATETARLTIQGSVLYFVVDASNTAGDLITNDLWYHFVAWCDGTKLYLSLNNSAAKEATDSLPAGTDLLTIGKDASNRYHDGQIEEVGYWSRVLTADERAELYNLGRGKYYDFS